jgi:DNA-binding response OmpR family regulator
MNAAQRLDENGPAGEPYGAGPYVAPAPKLRCGAIEIDPSEGRATVAGREVGLTNTELMLLQCFLVQSNRLLTRSELLAYAWNTGSYTRSNLVDVIVCRLRRKLGAHGPMIETVHGLGYRFRAPGLVRAY